ncbi:MAG: hypothetical protein R3D55_15025 [Chloroflexota bacterium]
MPQRDGSFFASATCFAELYRQSVTLPKSLPTPDGLFLLDARPFELFGYLAGRRPFP